MKVLDMPSTEAALQCYTSVGPMTDAGEYVSALRALPRDVARLCEIIQGLLIHRDFAKLYGVRFSSERVDETHLRPLAEMLERITALDDHPLAESRSPEKRLVSTCRDYALMLCAILRYQGVPARARCGFGAYFTPGHFEDHWVCEHWDAGQARWILVDAQLDALQRKVLPVDFDPLDVPRDRFLIAGDAWQRCRAGRVEPYRFGLSSIPNLHGLWFIAGNVLRDLASLNHMELLPWDVWGLMPGDDAGLLDDRTTLFDRIATLTLAGDDAFPEVCAIYQSDDRLRVPPVVFNALRNAPEMIAS